MSGDDSEQEMLKLKNENRELMLLMNKFYSHLSQTMVVLEDFKEVQKKEKLRNELAQELEIIDLSWLKTEIGSLNLGGQKKRNTGFNGDLSHNNISFRESPRMDKPSYFGKQQAHRQSLSDFDVDEQQLEKRIQRKKDQVQFDKQIQKKNARNSSAQLIKKSKINKNKWNENF